MTRTDDQQYVAEAVDMPGCVGRGRTVSEAFAELVSAIERRVGATAAAEDVRPQVDEAVRPKVEVEVRPEVEEDVQPAEQLEGSTEQPTVPVPLLDTSSGASA